MMEFKSPKKQRKYVIERYVEVEETADLESPVGDKGAEEVGGNAKDDGLAPKPRGSTVEPVTDAARAFTLLRVRPAASGIDHVRARSPSSQPRSPKKRKASVNIDKEFILKDEKVKRNTGKQGDISEARGVLGQLLFEFRHLELNKDIIEAIKRTESRTGRSGKSIKRRELDRIAFEYVVAEAGDLLHTQMSTVVAHTEDVDMQRALLRAYAVQAIATFADEECSESEDDIGGRCSSGSGSPVLHSPQHQPTQDLQHDNTPSRDRAPPAGNSEEGGHSPVHSEQRQSIDMTRAGSVTPVAPSSSRRQPELVHQTEPGVQQDQQLAPHREQDASENERVSSSVLPDAPPVAALEDTAAKSCPNELHTRRHRRHFSQEAASQGVQAEALQQSQRQPVSEESAGMAANSADYSQRQHGQQFSGLDDVMQQLSDAVDDMLRSPDAAVSSKRPGSSVELSQPTMRSLTTSHAGSMPTSPDQGHPHRINAATASAEAPSSDAHLQCPIGADAGASAGVLRRGGFAPGLVQEQHGSFPPAGGAKELLQQAAGHEASPQHQDEHASAANNGDGKLKRAPSEGEHPEAGALDGPRLPPLAPSLQPVQQQGGSNADNKGPQQPAVHVEALKRQRTSTSDDRAQVRPKHDGMWLQRLHEQDCTAQTTSHLYAHNAPVGASPQQQQVQQQQPGDVPALPSPTSPRVAIPEAGPQQDQHALEGSPAGAPGEGSLETRGAGQYGSSVWGSTLVCADLTVNDVASKYWPFLRSAVQGQNTELGSDDSNLLASLVRALADTIDLAYTQESGGRYPSPETKSLIAATAFDDMFRDKFAQDSSGA